MENLKRALSWLVVFAVGLAPMLVYWVARQPAGPHVARSRSGRQIPSLTAGRRTSNGGSPAECT